MTDTEAVAIIKSMTFEEKVRTLALCQIMDATTYELNWWQLAAQAWDGKVPLWPEAL